MRIIGFCVITLIACLLSSCTENITVNPGEASFWGIPEGTSLDKVHKIMEDRGLHFISETPFSEGHIQYSWRGRINYQNIIFDEITTFINNGKLTGIALTADRSFSKCEQEAIFKEPHNFGLSSFKPMNPEVWWASGDYYHMLYGIGETRDGNKNTYVEISRNVDTL